MKDPLGLWMMDNAELFRYAGEIPCMRDGASSVLLSGSASAFLAPLYRTLYPEAAITAVSDNKAHLAAAKEEEPGLIAIEEDPAGYAGNGFDIAVSVLYMQSLDTRELTPYLFNLSDSLSAGGNLYISFPSTMKYELSPKKIRQSWYSMEEEVFFKRYMPDDVMKALSLIGFDIRAVEKDSVPDLDDVVSIHAIRR